VPGARVRDASVHVQQRQVLLPARAHGGAEDARAKDRLDDRRVAGKGGGVGTITVMPVLAAVVWTYWISWFIIVPVVLLVVGVGILYLVKVVSLKYPKQ
jgi:hypothetical protein